jgi:hypothetical protein
MLRNFYQNMSLKNIFNSHPSGQITTLLILIMVIMLIFVLVTVNMGRVSMQTTYLANAADSAGLALASQLGTKAQQLYKAMGTIEECTRVNWLTTIFAIIGAVVLIVVTFGGASGGLPVLFAACAHSLGSMALTIGMGALGGALGGMAGAAAGGTSIKDGAVTGLVIGVAVGAAFIAAGTMATATTPGTQVGFGSKATVLTAEGTKVTGTLVIDSEIGWSCAVVAANGQLIAGTVVSAVVNTLLTASLGAAAVGITAGSKLYEYNKQVQMTEDFYSDLQKNLGGMGEYDRFREGTFIAALSQVVDDPRSTSYDKEVDCDGDGKRDIGDPLDTDGDGDLGEEIPCFQYSWYKRTEEIRMNFSELRERIELFFNTTIKDFSEFAALQIYNGGPLDRQAYVTPGDPAHADGILVTWANALEEQNAGLYPGNTNKNITFWKSGDAADVVGISENYNGTSWDEFYYDDIDAVAKELAGIVFYGNGLYAGMSMEQLANSWEDWIEVFDDADDANKGDFYDELKLLLDGSDDFLGVKYWPDEMRSVRAGLPGCLIGSCADPAREICNPACRLGDLAGKIPGSIDYDQEDEFTPARDAVNEVYAKISAFRADVRQFREDLDRIAGKDVKVPDFVTYEWHDERGGHAITVETHFTVPRIKKYKKNQSWGGLVKDVCVGIVPQYDTPTVSINRQYSDINRQIGFLGKWNPFRGTIKKACRAYWHFSPADGRYIVEMKDIK